MRSMKRRRKENTSYVHLTHFSFFLKSRSNKTEQVRRFSGRKATGEKPPLSCNASLCNFFFHLATSAKSRDIVLYLSLTWTREGEPLNVLWNFLTTFASACKGSPLQNLVRTQTFWCRGSYSVSAAVAVAAAAALIPLNETTQVKGNRRCGW